MPSEVAGSRVLEAIEHDLDSAVFSFIPNTAETSFWPGQGQSHLNQSKIQRIIIMGSNPDAHEVEPFSRRPRVEKIA